MQLRQMTDRLSKLTHRCVLHLLRLFVAIGLLAISSAPHAENCTSNVGRMIDIETNLLYCLKHPEVGNTLKQGSRRILCGRYIDHFQPMVKEEYGYYQAGQKAY